MMETFAMADSTFDFGKHHTFTDEEIKRALQNDFDNPKNSFVMSDTVSFDFNHFFADDLPKPPVQEPEPTRAAEDQPLPSIESPDHASANAQPVKSPVETMERPLQQNDTTTPTSTHQDEPTAQISTNAELPAVTGLKNESADPLLFNLDNMDDLFGANDATMSSFDNGNTLPTLASPFQPPGQATDEHLDFMLQMPSAGAPTAHMHGQPPPNLAPPHHFPNGRRRSQTVPPDFEPGMSFQRRIVNGTQIPINRAMHPPQAFAMRPPNMRQYGPEGPHMPLMPRSYPITPPSRMPNGMMMHQPPHDFMGPSRPQSLNPGLRMSLLSRSRDISPDRGGARRSNKRQKQSHDRMMTYPGTMSMMQMPAQDVDFGAFGMDQAMVGVEFMLRDAVEKARYARDEEVEKLRSESRTQNALINSLEAPLAPMASKDAPPIDPPKTGSEIKALNTQGVQALLDFFDIPFVSTMFLHDKKLLYLNFLGASGTLKHLVLD